MRRHACKTWRVEIADLEGRDSKYFPNSNATLAKSELALRGACSTSTKSGSIKASSSGRKSSGSGSGTTTIFSMLTWRG